MREVGALQVLKKKLSLQPLFAKEKSGTSSPPTGHNIRNPPSSTGRTGSVQHSLTSTASWDSQGEKYRMLKLSDVLSVSIGDSFDANPSSNVEELPKFQYGPIRYPKTTRLLLILPAMQEDKEPLETILFHADLKEAPYQALSCAHGDRAPTKLMHCNGRGLAIPDTLYEALMHLRSLGDPKAFSIVWADAISFNHADAVETEGRLRLIQDIFTSAHVAIAHFGGTDKQRHKVFETVDMLHEACQCDDFRERLEQDQLDLASLDHLSIGSKRLRIPPENRAELSHFFCHPWLERVWSWPEVGLSKKMFIMYGGALRSWSSFADAAWCMHQLHWESSLSAECLVHGQTRMDLKYYHMLHLDDHRQDVVGGETFTLLGLLTKSRRFSSANPLDRAFALWSYIGNPNEREIVQAFFDYSLSPLSVFLNLTLNSMISHETLDVLHLVHNEPREDWPSFVPDLSLKDGVRTLGSKDGRAKWEYHAAGDTKPHLAVLDTNHLTRNGIPYFEDDVCISLRGVLVDEVARVGSEMKDMTLGATSFLADWINTALMPANKRFYTPNELKRAKEAIDIGLRRRVGKDVAPGEEAGESSSSAYSARRNSIVASGSGRSGVNNESRSHLRSSFTPSLVPALKDLEGEFGTGVLSGEVPAEADATTTLPSDEKYVLGDTSVVEAFWRTLIKDKDENGKTPSAGVGESQFQPWFKAMSGSVSCMLEALAHGHSSAAEPRPEPLFNDLVHMSCNGSRIVRTETGLIGTAPWDVQEGDLVCVLYGGQTPFVLRGDERRPGMYRLVGDCYVHGIMEGEALGMGFREQEFVIS